MYLTVSEVLALPPLRELHLIAGSQGLDRQVTRVSVLEVVGGPGHWWRGGELFMTTLHILRDAGCDAYAEVMRTLVDHDAAALMLHPGLVGFRCLDTMTTVADELRLPLILMPEDMPYTVVTDAVMGGLLGRQAAMLERSAAVNRELIQVALRGGGLDDICRAVARRTHQPVAVVAADGIDVLAHSGKASDPDHRLRELLEQRAACRADAGGADSPVPAALNIRGPGQVQTAMIASPWGEVKQVAAPVTTRDEVCAYLVTWEVYGTLAELDFTVLAHACTAVGLEVLKERAVREAEQRVQKDFYGAALGGSFATLEEAEHRAWQAGVRLASRYIVASLGAGAHLTAAALRELQRWPGSVGVLHDGALVAVLVVGDECPAPLDAAVEILTRVVDAVRTPARLPAVGLGEVADGVLGLPGSLTESRVALAVAEQAGSWRAPAGPDAHRIARHDTLGVFQFLGQLNGPPLERYCRQTLAPLLAARASEELIDTLQAYLDAEGSHRAAAAALSVHPNTVKYRIARIRELLGDGALSDPNRRLGLHLALKGHQLLTG
ncbi:MAG TPA: PucR family transcriptional regulator ligand-binding domain-containing protein [Thermomicrobiaceae bacterium]|nr:PucR family transcriptional regulator ligand-binding domain-containing protein [Thermomicrobiaceae bacterium]